MGKVKKEKSKFRTMIGGQAIIEGIMMRGPDKRAIVVRTPDGELVRDLLEVTPISKKFPPLGIPVIRGAVGLFDSLRLGVKALMFSADYYPEDENVKPGKVDEWVDRKFGREKAEKIIMNIALVIGILVPVALFFLAPTLLAGLLDGWVGSGIGRNLIEGGIRMVIFLLFMWSVSRAKDVARVFAYHGAEHKTIHCYEAGDDLTIENVKKYRRQHPRCGTSFLLVVMIVSVLVFSFVMWSNPFVRMALRIALLPVVVGISYEINRWAGRHDNLFSRALRAPGVWLQGLTTREPDEGMIEVGIESLKLVIPDAKGKDAW